MKKTRWEIKEISIMALPLLIGVFAFLLVVGPRALHPSNIAWLREGDLAVHYLGWLFFRHSEWTFPLGLNPSYGLEFSNSILYSDSNPLLAFLFKPFSPWLPEVFQYFGFWLLACFVLQACFSWKLLGLISDSVILRGLGTTLFVFAPPMLARTGGHLNLVAHFLIIAALYLYLDPGIQKRKLTWGILLAVTTLVHPYLLVMATLIWLADLVSKTIKSELPRQRATLEFVTILTIISIFCWQAGYFSVGKGVSTGGYGHLRMNLLSLFDANAWSYILKNIPGGNGDDEGFNFLGVGVILLLACTAPVIFAGRTEFWRSIKKYPILVVILIALTVFAVSNNVGFGSLEFKYPLPEKLLNTANIFRASGRMFWPVFYMIVFAILFLVIRGYKRRTATLLLSLAVIIQITDTHFEWMGLRNRLMIKPASVWDTLLTDPIWEEFASRYTKVRWINPDGQTSQWATLAGYAATHRLATDSISMARIDASKLVQAQNKASESLRTGRYDSDSLYIIADHVVPQAVLNLNTETDALGKINGFNVLAPGWKKYVGSSPIKEEAKLLDLLPAFKLRLGEKILFDQSQPHRELLNEGWSNTEEWGTWSSGSRGIIVLPLNGENPTSLVIEARSFLKQVIGIFINGVPVGYDITLAASSPKTFQIDIPQKAREIGVEKKLIVLEFRFLNAASPKDMRINDDSRKLALGLVSITAH